MTMTTFKGILAMGEALRKIGKQYLTLNELTGLLQSYSGSFRNDTIKNYMVVLQSHGYIKSVTVNGAPMWEILKK
jgi:cystathionine beta-lyase family protein involved in aluminum resistance